MTHARIRPTKSIYDSTLVDVKQQTQTFLAISNTFK
jgi:hypothetical protein